MARSPRTGGANAWSIIAADPARNLVFIPTGAPSPDYYGGERPGDNRFANSIVALRADTGKLVWSFQTVHHDLWDYDVAFAADPVRRPPNGRDDPCHWRRTQDRQLFHSESETGKPVFGVEERPVPKSDVAGESSSPTQPFPSHPAARAAEDHRRRVLGPETVAPVVPRRMIAKLRAEGIFTPPSLARNSDPPGNIGGMAWGGAAFDRDQHLLLSRPIISPRRST